MRGRKPLRVKMRRADFPRLEEIAHSLCLPWYQVRRARIVLARRAGERPQSIAQRLQCNVRTVRRTCIRYEHLGLRGLLVLADRSGRPAQITPLQRAEIVRLACLEPIAKGLHITHWASTDLAREAVVEGIVPAISGRTVRRILKEVDLQPHRTRFWKTARLNGEFLERAIRILWCYTYADHLARHGFWVVCADELPNFQILERHPIRQAIPGSIEQREFEYTRHGTINILVFLAVHSGRMNAMCVDTKNADQYIAALRCFRRQHRNLEGVYLIHDGDPTHTSGNTQDYLESFPKWWRPCQTPAHASWLNQAELLLDAFELHYLKRGSWPNRVEFIDHINAAWPEYNCLYAHPFDWEWSIPKMRLWFAKHAS
jgi:transposase